VPPGDTSEMISSGKFNDFFTDTPYSFTDCGSDGVACEMRFCVSTLLMSRSVPTSNETVSFRVPSLALVDFM
jgi:hypothetical protein